MAARIEDTTIWLTRGDTLQVRLSIKDAAGEAFTPSEGDVIRFAMKERYEDSEPLILKTIDNGSLSFQLDPEDTAGLGFGTYRYDVELTTAGGLVDTFIPRAKLILQEEVH